MVPFSLSHRGSVRLISGTVTRSLMTFYLNVPRIILGQFSHHDIENICPPGDLWSWRVVELAMLQCEGALWYQSIYALDLVPVPQIYIATLNVVAFFCWSILLIKLSIVASHGKQVCCVSCRCMRLFYVFKYRVMQIERESLFLLHVMVFAFECRSKSPILGSLRPLIDWVFEIKWWCYFLKYPQVFKQTWCWNYFVS